MNQKLINTMKHLYAIASSSTCARHSGRLVPHTIGVRQGCSLSLTLFNIFLERIMTDALEEQHGTVSIDDLTNLRFADNIDGLAGEEQERANLVNCLDKTSSRYGMEICAEKTQHLTNSIKPQIRRS